MRPWGIVLVVAWIGLAFVPTSSAGQFVVFPKAATLPSPDGRFVVTSAEREGASTDFVGTFHSLWLTETATGRSRKLCDYLGVAAAAWADGDFLVVTQYNRHTSQAFVFSALGTDGPIMLNAAGLIRLVPVELRPALRENDHVFVEASHLSGNLLSLSVWGYGRHDANGFHWSCEYSVKEGTIRCSPNPGAR